MVHALAESVNMSILTRIDNAPRVLPLDPVCDRKCPHINSPSGIASSPTVLNDGDAHALHSTQSHTRKRVGSAYKKHGHWV